MHDAAKLARQAKNYRALVDATRAGINAKYGAVIRRKGLGEYLNPTEYGFYLRGARTNREFNEAQMMRSHHGRNAKLRAIMKAHDIAEPAPVWQEIQSANWDTERPAHQSRASQAFLF
jgi:hypothetical protein